MSGRHTVVPGAAPRVFHWWREPERRRTMVFPTRAAAVTVLGLGLPLAVHVTGTMPDAVDDGLIGPPVFAPFPSDGNPVANGPVSGQANPREVLADFTPERETTPARSDRWGMTADTARNALVWQEVQQTVAPAPVAAAPAPVPAPEPAPAPAPEPTQADEPDNFLADALGGLFAPGQSQQ